MCYLRISMEFSHCTSGPGLSLHRQDIQTHFLERTHYLNQCWLDSLTYICSTRGRWVNMWLATIVMETSDYHNTPRLYSGPYGTFGQTHFTLCPTTCDYSWQTHYNDITMSTMASEITSLTTVYSNIYSGENQWKHQSSVWWEFTGDTQIPHTKGQ